jgi:hypothetical protein
VAACGSRGADSGADSRQIISRSCPVREVCYRKPPSPPSPLSPLVGELESRPSTHRFRVSRCSSISRLGSKVRRDDALDRFSADPSSAIPVARSAERRFLAFRGGGKPLARTASVQPLTVAAGSNLTNPAPTGVGPTSLRASPRPSARLGRSRWQFRSSRAAEIASRAKEAHRDSQLTRCSRLRPPLPAARSPRVGSRGQRQPDHSQEVVRYSHHPGASRPQGREDHDDLHARSEPRRPRRAEPRGSSLVQSGGSFGH